MTMDTKEILLVAVPVTGALAVNSGFPVSELVTVTLTAKTVRLGKVDQFAGNQPQLVAVLQVVAIGTPPLPFCVVQDDIGMEIGQDPTSRIRLHRGMAL